MQYATFYLNDDLYGIPILAVREITRPMEMTNVDGSADVVMGLINLRGQIVTVLNLKNCLGLTGLAAAEAADCRMIIMKTNRELSKEARRTGITTGDDTIAWLVTRIGDVVEVPDAAVEPAPAHIADTSGIRGVMQLKGEILTLLLPDKLFDVAHQLTA